MVYKSGLLTQNSIAYYVKRKYIVELSNPNGKCITMFKGVPSYRVVAYCFKNRQYIKKKDSQLLFSNFIKKLYGELE